MPTRMEREPHADKQALIRLTQTFRTLFKFGRAVVEAPDERQLLQSVCEIFVKDGGFRIAWIGYAKPDPQETIQIVAQAGHEGRILQNVNLTRNKADSE